MRPALRQSRQLVDHGFREFAVRFRIDVCHPPPAQYADAGVLTYRNSNQPS